MEKRKIGALPVSTPSDFDDTPFDFRHIESNGAAKTWLLKKSLEMSPEELAEEVQRLMQKYSEKQMKFHEENQKRNPDKDPLSKEQLQEYYADMVREETMKSLIWLKKYTALESETPKKGRGGYGGGEIPL